MAATLSNVLQYWRTSLADGALGDGTFRAADRNRFMVLPIEAIKTGNFPKPLVQALFRGKDGASTVSVRFWSLVTARKSSHAALRADGMPEIVAPVVRAIFHWASLSKARLTAKSSYLPSMASSPRKPLGAILGALFESPQATRNYLHPLVQKGAKNTIAVTNSQFLEGTLQLPMDPEEQVAIANIVSAFQVECDGIEAEIEAYTRQKRGLMQKLLTGEWRVEREEA